MDQRKQNILQFARYIAVGCSNTLLTLIVIFLCKDFLHINLWVSNAIGYIAGFVNSFFWNKHWVFHSHGSFIKEALKFVSGFVVCYCLQLGATWLLTVHSPLAQGEWSIFGFVISGYGLSTLLGMVVYTVANFFYNRAITFAEK
ncbi:MAG: GtrA family protein [Paramuribaculum sp.]|nr:GtrA family protein [Paramuribaculum sp.]MDE7470557.1 GtrA family protein [Paramuribaculum sp.]